MAIYLGLVRGLVVSAWLIHRDGIAIGRAGGRGSRPSHAESEAESSFENGI